MRLFLIGLGLAFSSSVTFAAVGPTKSDMKNGQPVLLDNVTVTTALLPEPTAVTVSVAAAIAGLLSGAARRRF